MPTEIKFPAKPFYIMSKIARSNWGLTITPEGKVVLEALKGTVDQVWTATPDPRGGAILRHVSTGKVLACQMQHISIPGLIEIDLPAGPLKAVDLDASDAKQLWRAEEVSGDWSAINTLLQWEAKINVFDSDVHGTVGVYRWDGGADNEEWRLIAEAGELTVDSVTYDMSKAVPDLGMPPSHCTGTTVDNTLGGTTVTSTYSLARTVTTQRSLTNARTDTTGHKYTQTFSAKGGVAKVVEVTASASFEQTDSTTLSLTDQKVNTESVVDTIATQVSVPAGKKYAYHIVVYYGKVTVPYTAHLTFQSTTPGAKPVKLTVEGVFVGVNKVDNEIVIRDVTSPKAKEQPLIGKMALA
ncbi:hypothetical protein ASD79_02995 [Caulobacter sp. Root655]|uniref:hypothetical protein n=1 Tax=Caulobacter sp. Root655 TaxID=1736578 RepID=UPI0007020C8C|nr:hypothetical protein [Caulobacter sp. Root655]KRA66263.1 hypothetical protein ASD79_02995 [Caulobacter sp. Root655]